MWQSGRVADGDEWSESTVVTTHGSGTDPFDQPRAARRAASFGGGPSVGETVRDFVRRYGWRAYALPILLIVTVVALMTAGSAPSKRDTANAAGVESAGAGTTASAAPQRSSAPVAPETIPLKSDTSSTGAYTDALKVGQLPVGAPYTARGTDTYRQLAGHTKVFGASGRLFRYDIEVENGVTGVDLAQFAKVVDTTLEDPRSWSGHGVRVQRVSSGPIDFHVSLTSTMTVRKYCGYDIPVETSCYARAGTAGLPVNRVVLNIARWVRGAAPYVGDLTAYRVYMVNHEDGHAMGHQHAHQCLPGGLAPVMMQQTFGLKSAVTGKNCGANPWPYPPGAQGAPGAEQPDTDRNNEYYIGD
jgi:hypothetical protein